MNLTPLEFVILNGGLVILVVVSIAFLRKGARPPVRLRLMDRDGGVPRNVQHPQGRGGRSGPEPSGFETKSLNVFFNYNGHSWDAYEVLGVPAGSSLSSVQLAYERQKNSVEAESRAFLEAAYQAILQHKNETR